MNVERGEGAGKKVHKIDEDVTNELRFCHLIITNNFFDFILFF